MNATATVKAYANRVGWSDVDPFEVIEVRTPHMVIVREMNATRDESVKLDFVSGGFAAHCANQHEQRWRCAQNPDGCTETIRLARDGHWYGRGGMAHGARFHMADAPRRFYDYNF